MYAGELFTKNTAASGASPYCVPSFVKKPWIVKKLHKISVPRSEAWQRFAIVFRRSIALRNRSK